MSIEDENLRACHLSGQMSARQSAETFASTDPVVQPTIGDFLKASASLPKPTWSLITPWGDLYESTNPRDLLTVLVVKSDLGKIQALGKALDQ